MSDSQVSDAISLAQQSTMAPQIMAAMAAGKGYQSVAQSTAIAVQDAVDNLRNINTIAATAIGVAMAQLLATGEPKYAAVLEQAQKLLADSAANYAAVCETAAKTLSQFPQG